MTDVEIHLEAQHTLLTQLSETLMDVVKVAMEREKKTSEVLNKMAAVIEGIQRRELEKATAHWAPKSANPCA
jgi:rubrerythrin